MDSHSARCAAAGRKPATPYLRHLCAGIAVALMAAPLSACNDTPADKPPAFVLTAIVQPRDPQTSITLTGEVQARFRADLSFRVSGRVLERLVDVGAHVEAGDVLARLDPAEQQADLDAASALPSPSFASPKPPSSGRRLSFPTASRRAWHSIARRKHCRPQKVRSKRRRLSSAPRKMPLATPSCARVH